MKVAYMNLFGELQYLPNQTFEVAFLANFVLVTTKKTAGLLNLPDINIQTHWLGTVETFFFRITIEITAHNKCHKLTMLAGKL